MRNSGLFYQSALVLLVVAIPLGAGSEDLGLDEAIWLESFSYSTVIEIEVFEDQTYDLVTGTLQRTRGRLILRIRGGFKETWLKQRML